MRSLAKLRGRRLGLAATACACVAWCAGICPRARAATADAPQNRLPRQTASATGAVEGMVIDTRGRAVLGARVTLRNRATGNTVETTVDADGVFRLPDLTAGTYDLQTEAEGFTPLDHGLQVAAGEVVVLDLTMAAMSAPTGASSRLPRGPEMGAPSPAAPPVEKTIVPYRELRERPDAEPGFIASQPAEALPPAEQVFIETPDRWDISMPQWNRYGRAGEFPYVQGRLLDPFNRNRIKGDEPIFPNYWGPHLFGPQVFFNFTGTSETDFDGRDLPTPTGASTARPGETGFFGKGGQFALSQTFRFSFDLFHGDTSFRPVDWRIRVTPVVNVNYLDVQELGIVNVDVRDGTTRLDAHVGVQEAFFEAKIADLSPNYDFVSVRAGIQRFNSDFRGLLFVDEEPGLRVFGSLSSSRWQYNLAAFEFLEKDTNSGLNTFGLRQQHLALANVYKQDFLRPGYTAEFSVHYSQDDASTHYDDNGFLVRPAPLGSVLPHAVRSIYLGWTGDGHFGPWNVTHAFYQALGDDSLNPIAERRVTIDAQMAAAEISRDHDWMRFKASVFYASGDADPRDGHARGFDSIVDDPDFAGGTFSLWDREGIRLTGTGVGLTQPDSLLPDLRPNKEEGQANFVNPGIFLINGGADFNLTTKLKVLANVSYLRFMDTAPLELLLFQSPIRDSIGFDYSLGVEYRPPLSENIVLRAGAAALSPGAGLRDIYTGRTFASAFADVRFQF